MTTTYDPKHPLYFDEPDVREEMTRVYDVCHGCRRCVDFCSSFPTLFELIDRHDDHEAGRLTPSDQDEVVAGCFQCKRCYANCPYIPGLHEWDLDFPRLMLRARAMQHRNGITSARSRSTTQLLARADLVGTVGAAAAPLVNRAIAKPRSLVRMLMAKTAGLSAVRLLPAYARQRFTTWFDQRQRVTTGERQGAVTVYPTCHVEYQGTGIGKDLVKVYERNGVDCDVSRAGCCGAPWLHAGDVRRFTRVAERNVKLLADEVRRGTDIVVPQPTCGYVVKNDYVDYVSSPDAELVADHTYDAAEYLMELHWGEGTTFDTEFTGEAAEKITYHAPCHLRSHHSSSGSRDLMKLTGARVEVVQQCCGIDAMWGLRAENEAASLAIAGELADQVERSGGDLVAGDCHLANTAIREQTGRTASHPIQIVARAYGIPVE